MLFKKTKSYKSFNKSKYHCTKHENYFQIYDDLFKKYKNKKIIFVDIGVFSGGSLFMWRDFFGKKAKIIGIDLNPDAKRFEKYGFKIFIGDQSNVNFWKKFFSKIGKVDIVLDDGGHTNYQQIITTNCCIPNIKNNGIFVVEDVHTSYIKNKWYNPSKFSYINYCKKIIDDINSRFPNLKKYNYSLSKYIYSIENFESIVSYKINRNLCKTNKIINNSKKYTNPKEFRSVLDSDSMLYKIKSFLNTKGNFTYLVFLINSIKSMKFFK
tara:strand:+ start:52 stop:852 length:801 start_codon:yes stop_codon:yes gene_type:complete